MLTGISSVSNWPILVYTNHEGSALEWDLQDNSGYQSCISGYTITWNGGQYNTTDASTSVTREVLHQHGFPYCQTVTVTVTPLLLGKPVLLENNNATKITLFEAGIKNE